MIELFSGLLEILLEILPEILPDCIQSSTPGGVTHLMNDWACGPLVWDWALTIGGAVAGLISVWVLPYRLLQAATAFPLSFVFAPLATGLATWSIGFILRRMTVSPNRLATFSCGALFAFAMAETRWWLVVVCVDTKLARGQVGNLRPIGNRPVRVRSYVAAGGWPANPPQTASLPTRPAWEALGFHDFSRLRASAGLVRLENPQFYVQYQGAFRSAPAFRDFSSLHSIP